MTIKKNNRARRFTWKKGDVKIIRRKEKPITELYYEGHKEPLVCAACGKTYDPVVE